MIKVDCDSEKNTVIVEFSGNVDAAQAQRALQDIETVLAKVEKGFKLLVDYSRVGTMEPEVEAVVLKGMDVFNANGVSEVVHVLPDPDLEIGFNRLALFHYSSQVQMRTVRTRGEAEPFLRH